MKWNKNKIYMLVTIGMIVGSLLLTMVVVNSFKYDTKTVRNVDSIVYSFYPDNIGCYSRGVAFNEGNYFRIKDYAFIENLELQLDRLNVNYTTYVDDLRYNWFDLLIINITDDVVLDFVIDYYYEDFEYCDAQCNTVKEKVITGMNIKLKIEGSTC